MLACRDNNAHSTWISWSNGHSKAPPKFLVVLRIWTGSRTVPLLYSSPSESGVRHKFFAIWPFCVRILQKHPKMKDFEIWPGCTAPGYTAPSLASSDPTWPNPRPGCPRSAPGLPTSALKARAPSLGLHPSARPPGSWRLHFLPLLSFVYRRRRPWRSPPPLPNWPAASSPSSAASATPSCKVSSLPSFFLPYCWLCCENGWKD